MNKFLPKWQLIVSMAYFAFTCAVSAQPLPLNDGHSAVIQPDSPNPPSAPQVIAPESPVIPSIAAPPADAPAIERLKWEVQFAEGGFELNPSPASRSTLVSGLERLAGALCMPDLFVDLQDTRLLGNRDCLDNLDRLLKLDAGNPVGTCLRDGIYSQSCRRASRNQTVEAFKPKSGTGAIPPTNAAEKGREEMQLAFKLDSSSTTDLRTKLQTRLSQAKREWESQKITVAPGSSKPSDSKSAAQLQANLVQAQNALLGASCKVSRIRFEAVSGRLEKENLLTRLGERRAPATKPTDPLLHAMATFFPSEAKSSPVPKVTARRTPPTRNQRRVVSSDRGAIQRRPPTPSPQPTPVETYVRVRYISEECARAISLVASHDKGSAGATCHLYGPYSSQCVIATRAERARLAAVTTGTPQVPTRPDMMEQF